MAPRVRRAHASSKPKIAARRRARASSIATSLMANASQGAIATSSVTPTPRVMSSSTSACVKKGSTGAQASAWTHPHRNTAVTGVSHVLHLPMARRRATRMGLVGSRATPVSTSAVTAAWRMIRSITAGRVVSLAPLTRAGQRCAPRRGSVRSSATAASVTARGRARRVPRTRRIRRAPAALASRRRVLVGRCFAMGSARRVLQTLARLS